MFMEKMTNYAPPPSIAHHCNEALTIDTTLVFL
ncbi:hypothetical protein T03_11987 [Trichinella britovi]|uniref:Uncharacterized protein n=1 Tax=Trichinella britovi TaxID=45882 RepID=A0A0V1BMI4_TRIBR|nr:hypothetical protein T03_11987 [Trichinella britovi]